MVIKNASSNKITRLIEVGEQTRLIVMAVEDKADSRLSTTIVRIVIVTTVFPVQKKERRQKKLCLIL